METVTIHKNKLVLLGSIVASLIIGVIVGVSIGRFHDRHYYGRMGHERGAYMGYQQGMPYGGMMRTRDYNGGDTGVQLDASGTVVVPNNK